MAVDNPSYFSLRGADASSSSVPLSSNHRGFTGFFRRSKQPATTKPTTISRCDQQQQQPAPRAPAAMSPRSPVSSCQRRSFRSLFRSASASADCEKTRQFLKGEPRPSDVAPPSPYLNNNRSHMHSESSRLKSSRRGGGGPKSTGELLSMDMIFCGLPGEPTSAGPALARRSEDNDYYRFERDSECGSEAATLPIDDAEDERSYYNLTATLPSLSRPAFSSMGRRDRRQASQQNGTRQRRRRRHSIGTFLEDERCALNVARRQDLVVEPEAQDLPDHSDECSRLGRAVRAGTRHVPVAFPSSKPADCPARDDVVFISSKDNEASALWVNYLTACFEQISRQQGRPPFRVAQVTFEEPFAPGTDLKIRNSRLQIVVVCPVFLERVTERPEQATTIARQLYAERVLAMMLGVQDSNLDAAHRASLVTYQNWRKFFVKDQDETFVGQFLGAAVAILGNAATNNLKIDKTGFSVHPKKVKTGQSRILALLNEPLHPEDAVSVTVDRCGEAIEVGHVKRRNPYTLQFSIPDRCLDVSMLVAVRISRNGTPLGSRQVKCESRLRELDQILRAHDNPLEFMCQTFGFNPGDKEQLDNWMVHAFQKNIPPHFNLLSNPPGDLQLSKNHSSSEENPTLLHFAARFGLEKLAWQLLECPGGDIACDLRNTNDFTPADLAEQAGHVRLAHQLRNYMQMNEFSNMYSYLKVMSENANGSANCYRAPSNDRFHTPKPDDDARQEDYCRPRPLSEAYSVPPIARPVTIMAPRTFPDYSTPPPLPQPNPPQQQQQQTDDSASTRSGLETPLAVYASTSTLNISSLELPLQGLRSPDSASSTPTMAAACQSPGANNPDTSGQFVDAKSECGGDQLSGKGSSLGRSSQSSKSRESPQDELLEIITDFKNNVFTISEVERLVENWRNRNDVQQSFKDKQRQLAAMRDEYERIQKRIKDEMKAPTPFDRIKKFFTKGKKDSKDSANTSEEAAPSKPNGANSNNLTDRRPVSSLSLHSVSSSTSSGRMSTVSGCSGTSLGDSGTHSDTDDRRVRLYSAPKKFYGYSECQLQHPVSEDRVTGITSYEIPPAPKPFHGRQLNQHQSHQQLHQASRYTPTPSRSGCPSVSNSELDLRAVKSSHSAIDDKEYYIAFPPSGLPIHSFKPANGSAKEPKTPGTPIEHSHDFPSNNEHKTNNNESTANKFNVNNNYANVGPILQPPPGMCIPFQYVNFNPHWESTDNKLTKPEVSNVMTIKPEIHPEPSSPIKQEEESSSENNENANVDEKRPEPESPKILNTDHATEAIRNDNNNVPDYTNVQVAASEEIARNFGVTLKKLPAPPVPPRCEFNFSMTGSTNSSADETAVKNANE